jgi:hypothetical protein
LTDVSEARTASIIRVMEAVVTLKLTDVSEARTASIIRVVAAVRTFETSVKLKVTKRR